MSKLEEHARFELRRAGLLSPDSDYGGMIGEAVLALIKVFASQEHSGFSALQTLEIFQAIARFKALTTITADPVEWADVSEHFGEPMWQCRRQSSCFSTDGGKTYFDQDVDRTVIKTSEPALFTGDALQRDCSVSAEVK